MGRLDRVWRVWNFITQTQPTLTHYKKKKKKKIVIQPSPSSPKNRSNPAGWVESDWFWRIGGLAAHP